ncbi:uncharacterized protein V1513DRAFT_443828 [Lipomyces chichibuensis]|uniref:uncharacterized protein n=1 Tax=Lipomyces chichibuensis TaxID=1546026 RepID=UPI0033434C88
MALNWPSLTLSDEYAIRSQRDLTLNVSIDQLVNLAINLNSVLLEPLNYTSDTLSNFATIVRRGATRVFLDIYWNSRTRIWQLCPFIPDNSSSGFNVTASDSNDNAIFVYDGKAYTCDTTITFSKFLSDVLRNQWIDSTDDNLNAQTIVLTMNLRSAKAAAILGIGHEGSDASKVNQATTSIPNLQSGSATSTAASAVNTDIITEDDFDNLAVQIDNALRKYVYTPVMLNLDRSKALTWNDTGASSQGWPLLENVLLKDFYRVLFSFGDIEVPRSEYDTNLDADYIFSNDDIPYSGTGVISYTSKFSSSELNAITSPVCTISNGNDISITSTGAALKPSWLIASDTSANPFSAAAMLQYMKCGFSPVLNATLGSSSDILQYVITALESSRWSWMAGQPTEQPDSTPTNGATPITGGSGDVQRCAALTESGWAVENCYSKYKVACRVAKSPYNWTLSQKKVSYYDAIDACTGDTVLSLPRTALQNTMLQILRQSDVGSDPVWIDMNSIERANCWVSGGPGATCIYNSAHRESIAVVVPTIAAVVVAVLLALTLCSKLLGWKQVKARRKRRRIVKKFGEMEYDGVPS